MNRIFLLVVQSSALAALLLSFACSSEHADSDRRLATAQSRLGVADCPSGYTIIEGTPGADVLNGTPGNDCILGGDGNDVIDGRAGRDVVIGGAGDDTLLGGANDDRLYGEAGDDIIDGGGGRDTIDGGDGNDFIDGGGGGDSVNGGAGNDVIETRHGDSVDGGPGQDSCAGAGCEAPPAAHCSNDAQCSAGQRCLSTGVCAACASDAECDDGLFCNGPESCVPSTGCAPGIAPVPDDGDACTIDACDEASDQIVHTLRDCNDGNPCTADVCDISGACSSSPVPAGTACGFGLACNAQGVCEPVDACATNNGGCDPLTTCTNTNAGPVCGPCPPGYGGTGETGCLACPIDPVTGPNCDDPDCHGVGQCEFGIELSCADGFDNDNDSLVDCADVSCAASCPQQLVCAPGEELLVLTDTGLPVFLPDLTTVIRTFDVTTSGTVTGVSLALTLFHTFDSDIDVFLTPPGGTRHDVTTDNGAAGDNYLATLFLDSATTSITAGVPPFRGTFRPEQAFASYAFVPASGVWSVSIFDDVFTDTGVIRDISLALCIRP